MIKFENINYCYDESDKKGSLEAINLEIPTGQVVVFCGASGSGKTTMTRIINGLIPHYFEGNFSGKCCIDGTDTSETPIWKLAEKVGNVFQNPRSQFFNIEVESEVAFGCENMGLSVDTILKKSSDAMREIRIENLVGRSLFELSGGEKQKVACASASAQDTDIIVLDEPTSNLDSSTIHDLKKIVLEWKKQGKTVVLSEHRLSWLIEVADRFICFSKGHIVGDYSTEEFVNLSNDERKEMGLRAITPVYFESKKEFPEKERISIQALDYKKYGKDILKIDKLEIPSNAIVGIVGENGAGKTTLVRCLAGLERCKGSIALDSKKRSVKTSKRLNEVYMVFQDVNHQLFTEDLIEELMISMKEDSEEKASEMLEALDLAEYADRHPLSLSGGQKQRVAIGSALVSERPIIIYDEPTSGLDYGHMQQFAKIMKLCKEKGRTQILVSHDPELLNMVCDYCIFVENGSVKWSGFMNEENAKRLTFFFNK